MNISIDQILKDLDSTYQANVPKEGLTFEQVCHKLNKGEKSTRKLLRRLVAENKVEVILTQAPDITNRMNIRVFYVFR